MKTIDKSEERNVNGIVKKLKKGYEKWPVIDTEDYLKKKKIRKENTQQIDTDKTDKRQAKIKRT